MMIIPNITGKKYAILGLGKSGIASAGALIASGAQVFCWDDHEASRNNAHGFTVSDLSSVDVGEFSALILSPGIAHQHNNPQHPIAQRFHQAGIPIMGDIDLLFRAQPTARYIGITGTNGKSTTTSLIYHILKESGLDVQVGGNLGTPVTSFHPPQTQSPIFVLELSSYQLELMQDNLLDVALLLNITPDHIDHHGSMENYITAKKRIIAQNKKQVFILGTDEVESAQIAHDISPQKNITLQTISTKDSVAHGLYIENGFVMDGDKKIFTLASAPRLAGLHNAQNICAAILACRAVGMGDLDIAPHIKTFPGLPHRLQWVFENKTHNILYINDSKATNADAAGKALASYNNIYWIIGGRPKAGGLNSLESFAPRIAHAFIIGEAMNDFAQWCKQNNIPHTMSHTLDKAVIHADAAARKRTDKNQRAIILLSPACASWDQFKSFEDRGDKFSEFVHSVQDKEKS